ncbi:MAG TPA: M13 family metallopeptidase [Candidatus Eisenbacteria bacterium]|nr:M13 family metallopeptidase [Candidatus Eisenbacteria bacterium]
MLRRPAFALAFVAAAGLVCAAAALPAPVVKEPKTKLPAHAAPKPARTTHAAVHRVIDPSTFDTSVKPGEDFYRYVNGTWMASAEIPADETGVGSFLEVRDRNQAVLRRVLERAAAGKAAPGTPEQLVGDFYASGMDSARIDAQGAKPIAADLAAISAIQSVDDLRAELAHLQTEAVRVPFPLIAMQDLKHSTQMMLQIPQGGLGLPDRDYYLKQDPGSQALRDKYQAHVSKMLQLAGDDAAAADAEAKSVMAFETRLAGAQNTRVERRDPEANYHPTTLDSLEAMAPEFQFRRFFAAVGLQAPAVVNVAWPKYLREVNAMVAGQPLDDWKAYLRWHLVRSTAGGLSSPFVQENWNFYAHTLSGTEAMAPRWRRVLTAVDGDVRGGGGAGIGEALGQLYVKEAFSPAAKARAREMVDNLRAALRERIATLDWMSDATKQAAIAKLDAFQVKVGYPDHWRDYAGLTVARDDWFGNIRRSEQFELHRNWDKLGKPVDRTEWGMTPPTVNAYYNSRMNEIVFPAGILQPPFFDPDADDAVIYGGIGTVIGHEMTHGFDDQGRKSDAVGNLRDWWTPEDAARYKERADKVARQFDGYVAVDTMHVNGRLTLGENIADLGGVAIAYAAMEKALAKHGRPGLIDGLTPEQRFFVSYARIWRQKMRPETIRLRTATDPHSPGQFRCDGPLSNLPEFAKAWGAKDGDAMVRAEADRARIW